MRIVHVNKELIEARERAKELVKKWNAEYEQKAQKKYFKTKGNKKVS